MFLADVEIEPDRGKFAFLSAVVDEGGLFEVRIARGFGPGNRRSNLRQQCRDGWVRGREAGSRAGGNRIGHNLVNAEGAKSTTAGAVARDQSAARRGRRNCGWVERAREPLV